MGVTSEFLPITAADNVIRAHLESAEIPALLMTVAHLTGDVSFLEDTADRAMAHPSAGGLGLRNNCPPQEWRCAPWSVTGTAGARCRPRPGRSCCTPSPPGRWARTPGNCCR